MTEGLDQQILGTGPQGREVAPVMERPLNLMPKADVIAQIQAQGVDTLAGRFGLDKLEQAMHAPDYQVGEMLQRLDYQVVTAGDSRTIAELPVAVISVGGIPRANPRKKGAEPFYFIVNSGRIYPCDGRGLEPQRLDPRDEWDWQMAVRRDLQANFRIRPRNGNCTVMNPYGLVSSRYPVKIFYTSSGPNGQPFAFHIDNPGYGQPPQTKDGKQFRGNPVYVAELRDEAFASQAISLLNSATTAWDQIAECKIAQIGVPKRAWRKFTGESDVV